MRIKFFGIFPVSKNQFIWIEAFFFSFFLILTVFFFAYEFPGYIQDPYILFHAKYLKYAALISTFFIVIEAQYVLNSLIKNQKDIIALQNAELKQQKEEIETQRDLLQQQYEIIAAQKKNITDSIVYASTIQKALLPEYSTIFKDFETFVLYRPKEIVSGDFYWFYKTEERIYIAIADCTGHGVPGAFMSLLGITYLNEIMAFGRDNNSPALILDQLRQKVIKAFQTNGDEEKKDGMDIAFFILEPNKLVVHYAGAHNPLYVIRKNDAVNFPEANDKVKLHEYEQYTIIELKADRMPIGLFRKIKPFTEITLNLLSGDTLYAFSDGYLDQFGGKEGKRLGTSRFKKLLISIQDKKLDEQQQHLNDTLEKWIHTNPRLHLEQLDDILVFGIRI